MITVTRSMAMAFAAVLTVAVAFGETSRPVPGANLLERMRSGVDVIGIVHFTVNTFTDREWGYGSESPNDFNPTDFSADQIVKACCDGGIKGLVIVAKHHDGFCLWPTKTTEHNITKSPFWKSWSPKLELEKGTIPLSNSNSKLELHKERKAVIYQR